MVTVGSIYIISADFENAIIFYRQLLEKDVDSQNKTRFAQFNLNGLILSIMNGKFDAEHPDEVENKAVYTDVYDDMVRIMNTPNCGKVVINLCVNDLNEEYERVKKLGIGTDLTEIRYVNAKIPYWYFLLKDLDGNTIEITGEYDND